MTFWDGTRWVPDAPAVEAAAPLPGRRLLSATAEALLITMLVFGLIASSVLAAKRTGATLSVEPNAAPAWGWATASGCGYGNTEVYLDIQKPQALAFMSAQPVGGCVTFTFTTDEAGTYLLSTRERVKNRWKTMATYTLPVE